MPLVSLVSRHLGTRLAISKMGIRLLIEVRSYSKAVDCVSHKIITLA